VAHPDLVPVCREEFDAVLGDRPNQLDRQRDDVEVTAEQLLDLASASGAITRAGLHGNVEVALLYLESWLNGNGAVAIHNLMEDAATAEISRSQIWQWVHNGSQLEDGTVVTEQLVREVLDTEVARIGAERGGDRSGGMLDEARRLFEQVALADDFADFLTLPAYDVVVARQ
jgi:malate synthase